MKFIVWTGALFAIPCITEATATQGWEDLWSLYDPLSFHAVPGYAMSELHSLSHSVNIFRKMY